jgi:sec-independent protein translocase protein TatC
MFTDESFSSFWGHVEELRTTFIRVASVIILGLMISLCFYQFIFSFFTATFTSLSSKSSLIQETLVQQRVFNSSSTSIIFQLPKGATLSQDNQNIRHVGQTLYQLEAGEYLHYFEPQKANQLLILSPFDGFLLTLKICFWLSLAFTSPVWIYFVLQFVWPALKEGEKQILGSFIVGSLIAIFAAFSLAYSFSIPFANQYLASFNAQIGQNAWSLEHYIDYTLLMYLGHAIAIEICWALLLLVHFRILEAQWLIAKRRCMIVAAFVLGALLTPPDVLTQLMLALPLIIVYECAILYAKWRARLPFAQRVSLLNEAIK